MKLVMSLVVRDDADVLDAQIAFHLNAGVDFVVATDHESADGSTEILERYVTAGYLHRVSEHGDALDAAWRTEMARVATHRFEADWLLDAEPDEFWWPRGESLKDVLVAMPPRYGVVQGLVRVFLPRVDDARRFAERMTVRRAPFATGDEAMGRLDWALRPLFRTSSEIVIGPDREATLDGRVPLRAWYPIEVLRFPVRSLEHAERSASGRSGPMDTRSRIELEVREAHEQRALQERWEKLAVTDEELDRGVADGTLVVDERLRDALQLLEHAGVAEGSPSSRFALPHDGAGHLALRAPNVVDDVAYAGECAAVREVDFEPLKQRITELERRIASLEARFWPRVRRKLAPVAGRLRRTGR